MNRLIEYFECPRHGTRALLGSMDFCTQCEDEIRNAPAPETMTPDEREAEMRAFKRPVTFSFDVFCDRVERLLRREIWTHELGSNWEGLCKEARWEAPPSTVQEIFDPFPNEKLILTVVPEQAEGRR